MDKEQKMDQNELEFLDSVAGQGFEGMGAGDYAIPFLKILQVGNPECLEGDPAHVPGAKAGMFYNTLTKRLYGSEINLIPLKYEPVWLAWAPNRGGLRGRFAPGSIPVDGNPFDGMTAKIKDEVCEIADNMIFYCLVADHLEDGPVVFPLSSTGLRHGKNWNAQILLNRTPVWKDAEGKERGGSPAAYYSAVWKLSLALNKNDDGSWYQIGTKSTNVEKVRFVTATEFAKFIEPNRKLLDGGTARVDYNQIGVSEKPRQITENPEY